MRTFSLSLMRRKRKASATGPTMEAEKDLVVDNKKPLLDVTNVFPETLTTVQDDCKDYDERKAKLLTREGTQAWDGPAKASATEAEKRAAKIVFRIREDERDNLFGNKASEAIPGPETLDMGGQFLTNLERIEQHSLLYKIAKRMPKGCHLHLHFNAELEPMQFIKKANDIPNMFIRSTQPLLESKDFDETEIVFEVKAADTPTADIFSADYKPDWKSPDARPWMLWSDFRESFTMHRAAWKAPQTTEADQWVFFKMILSQDEAYGPTQTVNGVWARFNQATRAFKGLVNYESIFKWYVSEAIDEMIKDGVMYVEFRPMLLDKSIPCDDGVGRLDHSAQMKLIVEEVRKKQKELEAKGELDKFPFGVKIIYCAPRSIPRALMQREIQDCMKLKQAFPDLICGFDLVGAEDRPNNIGFYREELLAMMKTCKELNISLPFMFHAGETLLDMAGSKSPANSNLYDAVLLNAKRIGHGFSLLKHPVLIEEFKAKNICIELCPISNELLHLCRNVKEHPYPEILAQGIECSINSDNPSLFSNSVSHEFYQVMVGSPTMNVHGWRQLAEWSIKHSCLSKEDKEKAYAIFAKAWADFCQWVIDEYGAHAEGLPDPI